MKGLPVHAPVFTRPDLRQARFLTRTLQSLTVPALALGFCIIATPAWAQNTSLPGLGAGRTTSPVPKRPYGNSYPNNYPNNYPNGYPNQGGYPPRNYPTTGYPQGGYPRYPGSYHPGYPYPYNNGPYYPYYDGRDSSYRIERLAATLAHQSTDFFEDLNRLAERGGISRKLLHSIDDFAHEAEEFHAHLNYDRPDRAHVDRWIDKLQDKGKEVSKRLANERNAPREARRDWSEISSLLYQISKEAPYVSYPGGGYTGQSPGGYIYTYPRR